MPDTPMTAAEFREEQVKEYGKYVAAQVIYLNGGRAFNPGDPVPIEHVEVTKVVSLDEVTKTTTKAGQALAAGTTDTPKG